jgi:hypothetical protein
MLRRILYASLVIGFAACALILYWHVRERGSQATRQRLVMAVDEPIAASPPRLARKREATPVVSPTAGDRAGLDIEDESSLMDEIRNLYRSDPKRSELLARRGRTKFRDSPYAEERDTLLVLALINQKEVGMARTEVDYYLEHHPNGRHARDLKQLRRPE